jgi:hypothetical protein
MCVVNGREGVAMARQELRLESKGPISRFVNRGGDEGAAA